MSCLYPPTTSGACVFGASACCTVVAYMHSILLYKYSMHIAYYGACSASACCSGCLRIQHTTVYIYSIYSIPRATNIA